MARIQTFLETRYTARDVQHSFHTIVGETIDCIDYFAQPGVKALAARGTPVTTLPPVHKLTGPLPDYLFNGKSDDEGHPRECPAGTVPKLRYTAAQIRALGGLDVFRKALTTKAPPVRSPTSPACSVSPDYPTYAHVTETFNGPSAIASNITGVSDYLGIFPTYVPTNTTIDHSLSEVWVVDGSGVNDQGCTCTVGSDCVQSVEVGITVDPHRFAPATPHFFIYSTSDGYASGCYDDINDGFGCNPWVGNPQAILAPGMALPSPPVVGGTPNELLVVIENTPNGPTPGWLISAQISAGIFADVGTYPAGDFFGGMKTHATSVQIGAEVDDVTQGWVVPMGFGFGAAPTMGYPTAGYHHDPNVCSSSACSGSFNVDGSTRPAEYAISTTAPPGPNWGTYFFYGDAPRVFWGTNYGYEWTPTSPADWSGGYYKGECKVGQPIIGLSRAPSGIQSHAVRCGQPTIPTTGSQCHTREFNGADNRGTTSSGDWDPNSFKLECGKNEYVLGISQSTAGSLRSILCCPGSGISRNLGCKTEILFDRNSADYNEYDWDPNYYKGQCTEQQPGYYVAGVSTPAGWVVGAAHALLCCGN